MSRTSSTQIYQATPKNSGASLKVNVVNQQAYKRCESTGLSPLKDSDSETKANSSEQTILICFQH